MCFEDLRFLTHPHFYRKYLAKVGKTCYAKNQKITVCLQTIHLFNKQSVSFILKALVHRFPYKFLNSDM